MRGERWTLSTLASGRLSTVSQNILIEKLMKSVLDEQTAGWTESWLNSQVQGVGISSRKSSWRPVHPRGQYWVHSC